MSYSGPLSGGSTGGGGDILTLSGNSGGSVGPDGLGNIAVIGDGSITTVGNPGTNSITVQITGTTNHSLLVGAGTDTLTNLGVATDGQIPIGSTGLDPVLSTITAGSGISVTNGAGSITIAATGGGGAETGSLAYFATAGGDTFSGWLECDGSVVSQATYPDLYAQIGLLNPPDTVWSAASQISSSYGGTSVSSVGRPLVYGNGLYVAVAGPSGSNIYTSTDALDWNLTGNTSVSNGSCVGYGNNLYLAGGSSGSLATSTDAITWTPRTSGSNGSLTYLTYDGSGLYLLSDTTGSIRKSTDGTTWSACVTGYNTGFPIAKVLYDNSQYTAVFSCPSGPCGFTTSTDSVTWTSRNPACGTNSFGVAASPYLLRGNAIYLCCSQSGALFSSTDGLIWTARNGSTTSDINGLAYGSPGGSDTYVLAANAGGISSSTDGITWASRTSGVAVALTTVTYGNGIFLAAGAGGQMARSTDGITWTNPTSGVATNFNGSAYGGLYVVGGQTGGMRSSTDAVTWGAVTSGTASTITCMTYGTVYVYGTTNGGISSSTDSVTWVTRASGVAATITCMSYSNSLYLAGTQAGGIISSTDTVTWTLRNPKIGRPVFGISWDGTNYTATGLGYSVRSTDLVTWAPSSNLSVFASITGGGGGVSFDYGAGVYVVGGANGRICTSTDLATWTERSSFTEGVIGQLIFENSKFMAGSDINGKVYAPSNYSSLGSSTDGITWTSMQTTLSVCGLAYGNEFVAIGNGNSSGLGANGIAYKANATYSYDTSTQFTLPTDAKVAITSNTQNGFLRKLYIKT